MRPLVLTAALCFSSATLFAAKEAPGGALSAIKLLSKGESKKIARIEARDGTPVPERWHIVVHDPKDENGVREYVMAHGAVIHTRSVSQFAEVVTAEEVVSGSAVKVDSDKLAELAQQYALANNVAIGALNYALKKDGASATPVWTVSCLDAAGKQLGQLVVSAGRGNVIAHAGFILEPAAPVAAAAREPTRAETERRPTYRRPVEARPRVAPTPERREPVSAFRRFFGGGERR